MSDQQPTEYVAIFGSPTGGKTYLARGLARCSDHVRMSLADPMREMIRPLADVAGIYRDGRKDEPLEELEGKSVRDILKDLGVWIRTSMSEDFLINNLIARSRREGHQEVVVDDLRCANEYAAFRRERAVIVRVDRPGVEEKDPTHMTEMDWPSFEPDIIFVNDVIVRDSRIAGRILEKAVRKVRNARLIGTPPETIICGFNHPLV